MGRIGHEVTDRRGGRGTDYRVDDSDVDGGGGCPRPGVVRAASRVIPSSQGFQVVCMWLSPKILIIHILTHKMNHMILCVLEGLLLIPAVVPDPQWSCWSCSRRCWKGCTVRPLSPKTKTHQSMSFAEVGHKKYIRRETIKMSRFHVPRNPGNVEIPYAHVCSRCMTFLCP